MQHEKLSIMLFCSTFGFTFYLYALQIFQLSGKIQVLIYFSLFLFSFSGSSINFFSLFGAFFFFPKFSEISKKENSWMYKLFFHHEVLLTEISHGNIKKKRVCFVSVTSLQRIMSDIQFYTHTHIYIYIYMVGVEGR